MIPRYARPETAAIWSTENRFRLWFEIEAHAADAMAMIGEIPPEDAAEIRAKAKWDIARVDALEAELKHDVLAFLTNVSENVGPAARHLHRGLTSSDVLDTAFAIQLRDSADAIMTGLDRICAALKARALEHKHTLCIGRSHGIHAEPTGFGLKLAGHYAAFDRARHRLRSARAEIATCALSGPVGTHATADPRIQDYVAEKLGLASEPHSTQVIPRDRHAMFFAVLAVIASSIENLSTEIRHLQRSEVREAEEYFSPGQKGSSAMPHKRNPVLTENLTGLARVVRAAVVPALENVTLWHERDISHSSVERMIGPDATVTLDFALHRLARVVETLVIHPDRMLANLRALNGLVFSQRVLLALTGAGMSREDAYGLVQAHAMQVWGGGPGLRDRLAADPSVPLAPDALDALFDEGWYLRRQDAVFDRVFG